MSSGWALVRASHPAPALAVTAATTMLAVGVGHRGAGIALVVAPVLASQLAAGWTNDWLDAERDAAVGRADKPVATGEISRRTVGVAGLAAVAATVPLALPNGARATAAAAAALLSVLLYNWPLKSTMVSVLPYVASFGLLPAFVVLALPGSPDPPLWLVAAAGLLGGGAHFANVLPDLRDDARTGVRGLPHRIGVAGSTAAAAALLLAATAALVFGPPGPPSWSGLAALALAVVVLPIGWYAGRSAVARGARATAPFRAVMLVAVLDVLLLVAGGWVG